MRAKHVIIYTLSIILSTACIRNEAPNAEADILTCSLPGVIMTTNPIINNNSIILFVGPGTDLSALHQNSLLHRVQASPQSEEQNATSNRHKNTQ